MKRINIFMTIFCAIVFAVITFALIPIYTYTLTDTVSFGSLVPIAVKFIIDAIEVFCFSVCYTLILFSGQFGPKKSMLTTAIYDVACLVRRIATLGMTLVIDKIIDLSDIIMISTYFLLDVTKAFIVAIIGISFINSFKKRQIQIKKAAVRVGDLERCNTDLTPRKLYDHSNPLQKSALCIGAMLSASLVISRIMYDVAYGSPQSFGEVMLMILYYAGDIMIAGIVYAIMNAVLIFISKKNINLGQ